jgi:hypothetical protein
MSLPVLFTGPAMRLVPAIPRDAASRKKCRLFLYCRAKFSFLLTNNKHGRSRTGNGPYQEQKATAAQHTTTDGFTIHGHFLYQLCCSLVVPKIMRQLVPCNQQTTVSSSAFVWPRLDAAWTMRQQLLHDVCAFIRSARL